jgi:hypothetical protein
MAEVRKCAAIETNPEKHAQNSLELIVAAKLAWQKRRNKKTDSAACLES